MHVTAKYWLPFDYTGDQLVPEPATRTTHNKHIHVFSEIRTQDPSIQTCVLDRAAAENSCLLCNCELGKSIALVVVQETRKMK